MSQRDTQLSVFASLLCSCVLTLSATAPLLAQAPAYFKALTVPPVTVGTCLEPTAQRTDRGARRRPAPRLVMSSRTPNARREMSLVRDSAGAVVGYIEMVHVSTARLASVGETVVASLRPGRRIVGYTMRIETQMSDSGSQGFDPASLQRMRERAKHNSSRVVLDALGQSKVRVLSTWLAKRCPG